MAAAAAGPIEDESKYFKVDVCVGDAPLPIVTAVDGGEWVVARFDDPTTTMMKTEEQDPYGERYTQEWPATPYAVRVTNESYPGPVEAQVFVDGKLAGIQVVYKANDERGPQYKNAMWFRGFASSPQVISYGKDTITQFLFTLPRAAAARGGGDQGARPKMSAADRAALESIRVVFHDVQFTGARKEVAVPVAARRGAVVSGVNKASAKDAKASTSTATGATLQNAHAGAYTGSVYDRLEVIAERTIRYGTKSQLQLRRALPSDVEEATGERAKKTETEDGVGGGGWGGGGGAGVDVVEIDAAPTRVKPEPRALHPACVAAALAAVNDGPIELE